MTRARLWSLCLVLMLWGCGSSAASGGDGSNGSVDGGAVGGGAVDGGATDGTLPAVGLAHLTISPGTLSPVFNPNTMAYTATVGTSFGVPFVVTPTATPAGATITVAGQAVASGTTSAPIALPNTTNPIDVAVTAGGTTAHYTIVVSTVSGQEAFVKAAGHSGGFGSALAFSADGNTMAVGAFGDPSGATGVGGDQNDRSASAFGAAFVFVRSGTTWTQQAYVKGLKAKMVGYFGSALGLSGDGNTLVVGEVFESSKSSGVGGDPTDTSLANAGAAFVYTRTGTQWAQTGYLKASTPHANAEFGSSIAVSTDGQTVAIGAAQESSAATGINGNEADTSASNAGAMYVFTRAGSSWAQQAYIKASNTHADSLFGVRAALSDDGNTLAVGSPGESSAATGVGGDQTSLAAGSSGAAYLFVRSGTTWTQQAYVKASNTRAGAGFGVAVALSGDTLAVGADAESSGATGIGGNQADTSASNAGAAYVFVRSGTTWTQQAYVKASNARANANFGNSVALSGDTLAIGSWNETSNATGLGGNQQNTDDLQAGAAYVFRRSGTTWSQKAYVKASNTREHSFFGAGVALAGDTVAVGAQDDASTSSGINGDQTTTTGTTNEGAVYILR